MTFRLSRLVLSAVVVLQILLYALSPRAEILIPIVVEPGTNLIKLTEKFCTSRYHWKFVADLNGLHDPYLLHPDEKIFIPLELLKAEAINAQLASVSGQVYLVRSGNVLKKLKKGDVVYPGQSVVTGTESYAHLVYPDQRYTRVASDSKFTMTYNVKIVGQGSKAEFFLEKGRITHAVKEHLKNTENFTTRTPVAVTGVRGTEYRVKMTADKQNFVETLQGNVAVSAQNKSLLLKKNEGTRIEENAPPSDPVPLPPPPEIEIAEGIFRILPFRIQTPEDTAISSYRMRISQDKSGEHTILEKTIPPGESFYVSALADGEYFVFFTAIATNGFESLPSGPKVMKIRTTPSPPILADPLDGKTFFAEQVTLHWLKGEGAAHYFIELAHDEAFRDPVLQTAVEANQYTFAAMTPGDYFVRVQAVAPDGFRSLYSKTDSWHIAKSPVVGTVSGDRETGLRIKWAETGQNMKYELQVSKDTGFSDLLVDAKELTVAEYAFSTPLEPATYHVRVRGVLPGGDNGPWSTAQQMKIPSGPFTWLNGIFLAALTVFVLVI